MTIDLFLVGGGAARIEVDVRDLHDVSEILRRERGLVGVLTSLNGDDAVTGGVLVPANRIALVLEG